MYRSYRRIDSDIFYLISHWEEEADFQFVFAFSRCLIRSSQIIWTSIVIKKTKHFQHIMELLIFPDYNWICLGVHFYRVEFCFALTQKIGEVEKGRKEEKKGIKYRKLNIFAKKSRD